MAGQRGVSRVAGDRGGWYEIRRFMLRHSNVMWRVTGYGVDHTRTIGGYVCSSSSTGVTRLVPTQVFAWMNGPIRRRQHGILDIFLTNMLHNVQHVRQKG